MHTHSLQTILGVGEATDHIYTFSVEAYNNTSLFYKLSSS